MFDFYVSILESEKVPDNLQQISDLRHSLLNSYELIEVVDLGAGSKNKSKSRSVHSHVKSSQKPHKWANLLFNLIDYYQYKNVVELGTSFGLTTAYLASTKANVISFEGDPTILSYAKSNFKKLSLQNIDVILGNINDTLPKYLDSVDSLDFVFFDANHTYSATISYFNQCLLKSHEDSCFVFDDIYWSNEMKIAWNEIKNNSQVSLSIDLFHLGIVFFKKGIVKQDFIIK